MATGTSNMRSPVEITQLKYSEVHIYNDCFVDGSVGAFGEVKLASLDRLPCAAKHFFCHNTTEEERVKIEQELQTIMALKHPTLVQCFGTFWCVKSGRPIVLTELLKESLPQFLKRQECIPYHIKVNLCQDTALALSYLHLNGYVHGDLTSSNILILGESRAKVTDYWMSNVRKYGQMKDFTEIEEKVPYMAPERIINPGNVSTKSDSYSFGVIVSEIDTATVPPFQKHSNQSSSSLLHLPKESPFTAIVQSCLVVESDLRPTFDKICYDLESRIDHNYELSMQESRLLKTSVQLQFASQLDDLNMKVLELQNKLHEKEVKLSQQHDMVNYLLKTNESLKFQLQSSKDEKVDDNLVTYESECVPDYIQQEASVIIESDQLQLSSTILGKGESGTIYGGTWRSRDIAFKRFLLHQAPPEKWLANLQHEVLLLTRLSHRNVIKIFGITTSPGHMGIVLELMHSTLHDILFPPQRNNVLSGTKKTRIVRHVGYGMEYLHSQNIYHGKLSSFSVLVSEDGLYKVANIGPKYARKNFKSYHTMDDTSKSFMYSAPEILRRDIMSGKHFQSADVYSLAMVAYEVMCGCHCYINTTTKKQHTSMVLQYNARPSLEDVVNMSQAIKELLVKCWDADSSLRLTAKQFISRWNEIYK